MSGSDRFPSPPFPEITEHYRFRMELGGHIAKKYATSDMMGLLGQDVLSKPPAIADVYVPLKLHEEQLDPEKDKARLKEEALTVGDALKTMDRLVISGPPGSGKSTIVRYLAHGLGRQQITPLAAKVGRRIPLPFILRTIDMNKIEGYHVFLHQWCEDTAKDLGISFTLEQLLFYLKRGWCVLLFDGVDELGEENRRKLRDKVIYPLCKEYPDNKVIVTGRPNGFQSCPYHFPEHESGRGPSFNVVPFDDDDIIRFAKKWFPLRITGKKDAENLAQAFLEALERNTSLGELKRRPVYLTMLAVVHETAGRLPDGRAEAYREILKTYISQLDAVRLRQDPDREEIMPPWPEDEKRRIIERLAYRFHCRATEQVKKDPRIVVSKDEILALLGEILVDLEEQQPNFSLRDEVKKKPTVIAAKVFEYFVARTGFLAESSHEMYQFSHLSFQEYLTALHIYRGQFEGVNRRNPIAYLRRELTERMEYDLWHEVGILFFCQDALDGGGNQDALLEDLLPQPMTEGFFAFWLKLLANGEHQVSDTYRNTAMGKIKDWVMDLSRLDRFGFMISTLDWQIPLDTWPVLASLIGKPNSLRDPVLLRLLFLIRFFNGIKDVMDWNVLHAWIKRETFEFTDAIAALTGYLDLNPPREIFNAIRARIPFWMDLLCRDYALKIKEDMPHRETWLETTRIFIWNDLNNGNSMDLKSIFSGLFPQRINSFFNGLLLHYTTGGRMIYPIVSRINWDPSFHEAMIWFGTSKKNQDRVKSRWSLLNECLNQGAFVLASRVAQPLMFHPELEVVQPDDIRRAREALLHPEQAFPQEPDESEEAYQFFLKEHNRLFGPEGYLRYLLDRPISETPITLDLLLDKIEKELEYFEPEQGQPSQDSP